MYYHAFLNQHFSHLLFRWGASEWCEPYFYRLYLSDFDESIITIIKISSQLDRILASYPYLLPDHYSTDSLLLSINWEFLWGQLDKVRIETRDQ